MNNKKYAYLSNDWEAVFPQTDVSAAVSFMQSIWQQLLKDFPEAIAPANREPEITQTLGEHLIIHGQISPLSGIFIYEAPRSATDPTSGKRVRKLRTDITYHDSHVRLPSGKRLYVIFEFKKLKDNGDSRSAYVGEDGMLRFIKGNYAEHAEHLAFMVGLINNNPDATVSALENRLKRPDTRSVLHILPTPDAGYVRKPSERFVECVNFDTVHSRTNYGELGDIVLCHFFLEH